MNATPSRLAPALLAAALTIAAAGCHEEDAYPRRASMDSIRAELSPELRRERAQMIKDAARARGLYNGLLLTGIADTETGMVHCWSEATWACQGPNSPDCDGGPVIAGAGDGPCEDRQGGLGMFQFDAGVFEDTLEREGERVLYVDGNVDAAVDFVIGMVKRSRYVDVETDQEALDFMNRVRPWNELHEPWIQTVVHYYNGCVPERCSAYDRKFGNYSGNTIGAMNEMGAEFFYGDDARCGTIPAEGGVVDDPSLCFGAGGNPDYWRSVTSGYQGGSLWTNATDNAEAANYAVWGMHFVEGGRYLLEVHTSADVAESTQTRYLVTHAGVSDEVVIDQTATDGFQVLGEFEFVAGERQGLQVGDNTGEPNDTETAINVDAIRLTRVQEEDPDPMPDAGVGEDAGMEPDVGDPDPDAGGQPDVPDEDPDNNDTPDDDPDTPNNGTGGDDDTDDDDDDDDLGGGAGAGADPDAVAQEAPKVKGCGCETASSPAPVGWGALALLGLALLAVLRR